MPHVVGLKMPVASTTMRLTFCVRDTSTKGYQIKPAKVPMQITLVSIEGIWSVINMKPLLDEPYDIPENKTGSA